VLPDLLNDIAKLPNIGDLHNYANSLKDQQLNEGQKSEQYPLLAHKLGHSCPLSALYIYNKVSTMLQKLIIHFNTSTQFSIRYDDDTGNLDFVNPIIDIACISSFQKRNIKYVFTYRH
jgi:hypothetical protein